MPIVHFHGEILPKGASISVSNLPKFNWSVTKDGPLLEFSVEIEGSRIHVTINAERYSPEDLVALYMRAFDLARTAVELVALKMGWGVSIILSTFVDPDGVPTQIFFKDNNLASLCTAFDLTNGFADMLQIVIGDLDIVSVLNDLIASITLPHVATVNCARAIEGIRKLIAGDVNSCESCQSLPLHRLARS